ncbi:MAG: sigma-54-dependent Fis family transcriptional regulator [Bacillota bacterium]|nr:sigma-54-dependent Fis family transcriptional regulator [Bacillota bacterium]
MLKILLDNMFNGIVIIDGNSRICFFNRAAANLLQLDMDTTLGRSLGEVMDTTVLSRYIESKEMVLNKPVKLKLLDLDVNIIPLPDAGKPAGSILVFGNIINYAELSQKLDEARVSEEILNTVIENAYDGIVIVDKEGIITMISKTYTEFLGITREEAIGRPVTEVIENTRMHKVMETGTAEVAQLQKIKGTYMIASRLPIKKDGEVIGAVGKVLFRNLKELNDLTRQIGSMEKELATYKSRLKEINSASYSLNNIIGESYSIINSKHIAEKAAKTSSNVLILGESGTGKEIFAHAIHSESSRHKGPFVKVNCAAIPSDLLESELFGYESGAFTGAKKEGKIGKFEIANEGTIFLDEIGDMPLHMQVKLLRVIQEREVEKVGGTASRKIDIRIIAATNRNLKKMVEEGEFREDLYYRLNVVTIDIPPLRDRGNDIILIANHLLKKLSYDLDKRVTGISNEASQYLRAYEWKGNVRELENVLERAINIMEGSQIIGADDLPKELTGRKNAAVIKSLQATLDEAEKNAIIDALKAAEGNRTKAAKFLAIGRTSLYEKMEKYKINI